MGGSKLLKNVLEVEVLDDTDSPRSGNADSFSRAC
jgi:hypothetical protein